MKGFRQPRRPSNCVPNGIVDCDSKTTVIEKRRTRQRDKEKPKVIGYARVSTKGQNHRLQIDALKAAGCTRIVREVASGADWERPLLKEMLASAQAGDTILVWRIDRWARDLLLLLQTTRDLDARGVEFRSVTESFDLRTPMGWFIMCMLGAFAEFEHRANKLRTEAGLVAARKIGHKGGRPSKLSEADMRTVADMLDDNADALGVAQRFGVSLSTLYRRRARADS